MSKILCGALVAASLACLAAGAHAAADSPVGSWTTVSDETGRANGVVEITEQDGVYSGRIVKLLEKPQDAVCEACTDARKGQPLIGMVFLTGLKADGDHYSGGEILDPKNGKVYSARMKLIDNGAKLEVRGFIGFALIGRTQTWLRAQ